MGEAVIRGGYYPSWELGFTPNSINTNLFTHIYYAFLNPNKSTFNFEIDQVQGRKLRSFASTLHGKNPPAKALFSVGGFDEDLSSGFARMASDPSKRFAFIRSCIKIARDYGFDGIDMDWEFPNTTEDMNSFGKLLEEFRVEIQNEVRGTSQPPLLLTSAVYYSAEISYKGNIAYPAASMTNNLDWANIMTYDYHGSWDISRTGAHAALYDRTGIKSTDYGLTSWIQAGLPKSKLIMGLPLFGKTWELREARVHGIGAPAVGVGPGEDGIFTYAEVVRFNRDSDAHVVHDPATVSDYSYLGSDWVGYDDKDTVAEKIRHARRLGLRGYFFWDVHGDYDWRISRTAKESWSQ